MRGLMRVLVAFWVAAWGHRGQKDKAGRPYLWHVLRVAWVAFGLTGQAEAAVVGLLHDLIEDVWLSDRRVRRFGAATVARLYCLTKCFGERYEDYVGRVCAGVPHPGDAALGPDRVVLAVKLADLLHNLDAGRRRRRQSFFELLPRHKEPAGALAAKYLPALPRVASAWTGVQAMATTTAEVAEVSAKDAEPQSLLPGLREALERVSQLPVKLDAPHETGVHDAVVAIQEAIDAQQ